MITHAFRKHYPWGIAGSGFLCQFMAVFSLNIVGLTITYLASDFNVSVTDVAILSSVFSIAYSLSGIIWGYLADKIGLRLTLTICGLGNSAMLIVFGLLVSTLFGAVVIYGFVGLFAAGLATSLMPKLVSAWFSSSWTGKAFIVVSMGGTIAGVVIGVLVPWIILSVGWRGVFISIGILGLCFTAIVFTIVRDRPELIGTNPYGSQSDEVHSHSPIVQKDLPNGVCERSNKTLLAVLKMPITWKIGLIYIFTQAVLYTNSTYLVATMMAAGLSIVTAGLVSSVHRISQTCGYFVWPPLSDHIARKYVLVFCASMCCLAFILLFIFVRETDMLFGVATAFIFIVFLGFNKAFVPLIESQLTELFPPDKLGTGSGVVMAISTVGSFFGPLAAGAIINCFGAYHYVWLFNAACMLAVVFLASIWLPKTGGKYGNPFVNHK